MDGIEPGRWQEMAKKREGSRNCAKLANLGLGLGLNL